MTDSPVLARMQRLITTWEEQSDHRSIFLSCYRMMTQNMLLAIDSGEFEDPGWVDKLLHNFSDYYFIALQAYEDNPMSSPQVWRVAHNFTRNPNAWALQKLLLGVNAHINYDLVLTLTELLKPEWSGLSEGQRAGRYSDYCYVNAIIGRTIDAVQDQVVEPTMPWMDLLDKMLGREDERLISRLLAHWREKVWHYTVLLLETEASGEQTRLIHEVEADALNLAKLIILSDIPTWLDEQG